MASEGSPVAEEVVIRPSRDTDVEAMLAIYRHHVRSGVPRDVEGTGAPEPIA